MLSYSEYQPASHEISAEISVIVPVYNSASCLETTIDCLRRQTCDNIEILLIDDGSSDESAQICRSASETDPRIRFFQLEANCGVSAARNVGLREAKGNYISFVDADDRVEPDMMEYLLDLLRERGASVSTCGIYMDYPDGRIVPAGSRKQYRTDGRSAIDEINLNGDFTPYLVDKLFCKSLLANISFQEGVSVGEDYRFVICTLLKNPSVIHGGQHKYHYVQHSESVTHRGLGSLKMFYRNRQNYRFIYEMIRQTDASLERGAMAYYILQEMAVITSMVKSGQYSHMLAGSVQRQVRRNLRGYLMLRRVPFYLKLCALLLAIDDRLLVLPYRAVRRITQKR